MSVPLIIKLKFLDDVVLLSFGDPPPYKNGQTRHEWIINRVQVKFNDSLGPHLDELILLSNTIATKDEANQKLNQFLLQQQTIPKSNLTQMLTSAIGLSPDPKIVQLMIEHYAVQANLWLSENNVQQLRELYIKASTYPRTSTKKSMAADGFYLDGPYQSFQNIYLGFDHTVPVLLKIVTNEEEIARIQLLYATFQNRVIHPSIASFKIYGTPSTNRLMIQMTTYPATLQSLYLSTMEMNSLFLDQMIDALQYLHELNFAHMDIKPTNIAIDYSGRFILIDLGSTCEIDNMTESTPMFVPTGIKDFHGLYKSSANTDFWMLATTLYSKHHEIFNRVSKNDILTFFANESYFDPLRNLLM